MEAEEEADLSRMAENLWAVPITWAKTANRDRRDRQTAIAAHTVGLKNC
jgi:hypothetical protein